MMQVAIHFHVQCRCISMLLRQISLNKCLSPLSVPQRPRPPGRQRALDCGAGIGRITRLLLSRRFQTVDAVEQCAKFVAAARTALADNPHVGQIYCAGE